MDLRTKLEIVHDDGGVQTNYSKDAQDFKRDTFSVTMTTDDFLYIGFRKEINAVYCHINTVNATPSTTVMEYYNGTTWEPLEFDDDTNAFARSGFITWLRPDDGAAVAIDNKTMCWVRISTLDDIDPVEFQAINLLFSDDNDICSEVPALIDACFYQQGATSHVLQHVAAKNYIMGRLRSVGYIKTTANGEENINEWDILDIFELRQASMYYAVAQIYFNLSDDTEDQYWSKYKEYNEKFEEAFALGRLRVDLNDDGKVDSAEKRPIKTVRWGR